MPLIGFSSLSYLSSFWSVTLTLFGLLKAQTELFFVHSQIFVHSFPRFIFLIAKLSQRDSNYLFFI